MLRFILALLLAGAPVLARAQTYPSPTFSTVKIGGANGQTITGVGTAAGTVAAGNDSRIVGAVQGTRQITAGAGLTGGGDLSVDRSIALPTTGVSAGSYTSSNITVDAYGRVTAATSGSVAVVPLGQARLSHSSASALLVKPYAGNLITINGAQQTIPSGGVTCSNTGLTAATLYYAYVYMVSATMTCEMVTTTHATNTSTGVEQKSGDATRTYVGMAYTGAGTPGTFVDTASLRYVASWFNRPARSLQGAAISTGISSSAFVDLPAGAVGVLLHSDEIVDFGTNGYVFIDTAAGFVETQSTIDGTAGGGISRTQAYGAGTTSPVASRLSSAAAEGRHTLSTNGRVSGASATYAATLTGTIR